MHGDRQHLNWADDERPDDSSGGVLGAWGAVLRDVRTLAVDLTAVGGRLVGMVPLDQLGTGWARAEEALWREIKARLDSHDAPAHPPLSPARLLDELLGASIEANSSGSRDELYRALLLRLVPDEARLLAALADGTPYPLVHVVCRGNGGRSVLSNASTIGRAAGVAVHDALGAYLGHLRALGLAEEGPADDSLAVQYDILLGEAEVRKAEEEAREGSRLGARVVRRTLRISPLGQELWRACRPDDDLTPLPVEPTTPGPAPGFHPSTAYRPPARVDPPPRPEADSEGASKRARSGPSAEASINTDPPP